MGLVISPIRWMGGKSNSAKKIVSMFPEHNIYVEVFGGGASVLFCKPRVLHEVYNDLDSALVNFYRVYRDKPEELAQSTFGSAIISRELFDGYKAQLKNPEGLTDLEWARAFGYVLMHGFGGVMNSPSFGVKRHKQCTVSDLANLKNRWEELAPRFSRVQVEHKDFRDLIRYFDTPETLFFLDPPYPGTAGYQTPWTERDTSDLSDICSNLNGKFLLTLNDCPEARKYFGRHGYCIHEHKVFYTFRSSSSTTRAPELIITNYDPATINQDTSVLVA